VARGLGEIPGGGLDLRPLREDGPDNHFLPFFGRLRLRDLSPSHVRALKARKLDAGMDPSTWASCRASLSAALNPGGPRRSHSPEPVCPREEGLQVGQRPGEGALPGEARALLAAVTGTRDETLVTLALRTGMRQGELAALRWEDLELDGPRPSVRVARSADTRSQTV
jgi:integrase